MALFINFEEFKFDFFDSKTKSCKKILEEKLNQFSPYINPFLVAIRKLHNE